MLIYTEIHKGLKRPFPLRPWSRKRRRRALVSGLERSLLDSAGRELRDVRTAGGGKEDRKEVHGNAGEGREGRCVIRRMYDGGRGGRDARRMKMMGSCVEATG